MHSAAMPPGESMPSASSVSSSPGGWPATWTGKLGTSSAKRSRKNPEPKLSAPSAGRYSFLASNDPSGSNTRLHSAVPPSPAASASRRISVSASAAAPNAHAGTRGSSSRGTSQTAPAKHATETTISACARGSQFPSAGG